MMQAIAEVSQGLELIVRRERDGQLKCQTRIIPGHGRGMVTDVDEVR